MPLSCPVRLLDNNRGAGIFLTKVAVCSPTFVLVSRPAGRLSSRDHVQLCHFVAATTTKVLIIDRSQALLGLLSSACRLATGNIACCTKGCSFCGRRGGLTMRTLRAQLGRGRGRLRGTQGRTHRMVRHRRGRSIQNGGRGIGGKIKGVTVRAFESRTRGDAIHLKSIRTSGVHFLTKRAMRLRGTLPSVGTVGMGFGSSSLRVNGVLVMTSDIGCSCKRGPL